MQNLAAGPTPEILHFGMRLPEAARRLCNAPKNCQITKNLAAGPAREILQCGVRKKLPFVRKMRYASKNYQNYHKSRGGAPPARLCNARFGR